MKKHWWKLLLGAVAVAAAGGLLAWTPDAESHDLLVQPTVGPFQLTVTTTGELKAKNSVSIYGPSNARQARIYEMKILKLIPEGTVVQKGAFVAELDRSELLSRIKDTELELTKAQSQYEQARLDTSLTLSKARDEQINLRYAMEEARLTFEQAKYEPPSVQRQAEIDFEKAERALQQAVDNYQTQVAQARAKVREAEAELMKNQKQHQELVDLAKEFTILAPENGMLVYKRDWRGQRVTEGGTVNAWDPVVATLPDLSVMESITYVNEVDIQKIQAGQPVQIGLDADPDKKLTGVVSRVANIGEQRPNSDAKVFEVAIQINEADTTLRPAMTTSNTIVAAEVPEALHIPLECIHARDSLTFVFVRRGGSVQRQEILLGLINENEAIVHAGLAPDDWVYMSLPADTTGRPLRQLEVVEEEADVLAAQ